MSKSCPQCRLINPVETLRCDCGYDFVSGTQQSSYVTAHLVQKAGGPESFMRQRARRTIQRGMLFVSVGLMMTGLIYFATEGHPPVIVWGAIFWGTVQLIAGIRQRREAQRYATGVRTVSAPAPEAPPLSSGVEPVPATPPHEWTIAGLSFDTEGWRLVAASSSSMAWRASDGTELTLETGPSTGTADADLDVLRRTCRLQAQETGGGIISVDVVSTSQLPVREVIVKRACGAGYAFEGALLADESRQAYTISVKANEGTYTGTREAMVSAQMWELGEMTLPSSVPVDGHSPIPGWSYDPYDRRFDADALNSVSDDDRLDVVFPQHPLSRVRRHLRHLRETLHFSATPPVIIQSAPEPSTGLRRQLSAAAVRELLWKHDRFDLLETMVADNLRSMDVPVDSNDPLVAREWLVLGIVQGRQGKLHEALESLMRAHTMFSASVGEHDTATATAATHLARALLDSGRLSEAQRLFNQVLPVLKSAAPNKLVLGMALNGFGRLLLEQGRHAEALPYVERARTLATNEGGGQRYFLLQETAGGAAPQFRAQVRVVAPAERTT